MIVTCGRCGTQFQLDDARVPKRGVRVRCSRCKNAFRVVPEAQRAAEEIAELARRAREEGDEETTQDLAEDSRGDSAARGARASSRRGRDARAPDAEKAAESSAPGGLLEEESDWKFNEDVEIDPRGRSGRDVQSAKPDPPEAAPPRTGAQNADDWFGGGGDEPLELDDRRGGAAVAEAAAPAEQESVRPEPPPAVRPAPPPATRPAPQPETRPAPPPAVRPETPPAARPALETLSAAPPDVAPVVAPEAPAPRAPAPVQPAAEAPADELSSESWDLLGEAEAAESEAKDAKPERESRRFSLPLPSIAAAATRVVQWIGYGAHALGWLATTTLFGVGLYVGLVPSAPVAPVEPRVAGLELADLRGRFVENAASGALFVVSGRVRNPGPGPAALQLELELLDATGRALEGRAALHVPAPTALLRESPATALTGLPQLGGALQAGDERAFEAVLAALPVDAAAFRIVEARGARGSASD